MLVSARSERAQQLVARVAELGPVFEERAHRYDRDASFPYENWQDLADIGFLGLCIPERYGGLGASFADYAAVAEEIGRHCGSTALTFNMHTCTCLLLPHAAAHARLHSGHITRCVELQTRHRCTWLVVRSGGCHVVCTYVALRQKSTCFSP